MSLVLLDARRLVLPLRVTRVGLTQCIPRVALRELRINEKVSELLPGELGRITLLRAALLSLGRHGDAELALDELNNLDKKSRFIEVINDEEK